MLGYESRFQVHALLKEYEVPLDYTVEDFQQDMETLHSLFPNKASVAA
jgi:predicted HTH domain antitoxin